MQRFFEDIFCMLPGILQRWETYTVTLKKKITYSDGYIKSLISPSTIGCFMPILSVRVHFSKMRPFSCGSKVLVDSWEDDTAKHIC